MVLAARLSGRHVMINGNALSPPFSFGAAFPVGSDRDPVRGDIEASTNDRWVSQKVTGLLLPLRTGPCRNGRSRSCGDGGVPGGRECDRGARGFAISLGGDACGLAASGRAAPVDTLVAADPPVYPAQAAAGPPRSFAVQGRCLRQKLARGSVP